MSTKTKMLGYINFSEDVVVSDPCYDRDVWCMKTDLHVKPGQYKAEIVYSDEGDFGTRVAAIALTHIEFERASFSNWIEDDAVIGVDSGQCGVFDDSIYPTTKNHPDTNTFYDECCNITLSEESAGLLESDKGVVSSSGYGDGSYILKTASENGEVVALVVDFCLIKMNQIMQQLIKRNHS